MAIVPLSGTPGKPPGLLAILGLIKMDELVTSKKWARRRDRVIRDLPEELATYKGLTRYRPTLVEWLSRHDDGEPTSPGFGPD